jgi:Ca2+-binding RTX toxin-like protein
MTTSNPEFIIKVLEETNKYRVSQGLRPLTANLELNATAQAYSEDMANQDYFNHGGKNGTSQIADLARSFGYEANLILDNLAVGNGDPVQVVNNDWLTSPGHKAQLDNPDYTELGVGYAYLENDTGSVNYGHYWTQVFGTGDTNPATNLPAPPPNASKGDLQAMLDALGERESGKPKGDPEQYKAENFLGFIGKYQFGELLLIDLGYYTPDNTPANDWQAANWTGKGGVNSEEGFKNAPAVQETAIRVAFTLNWSRYIKDAFAKRGQSVESYLGQTITFSNGKTVTVSLSGILAGAHLLGSENVAKLLVEGVVTADQNVPPTPITDYMDQFGGYDFTLADLSVVPPTGPNPPAPPTVNPPPGPEPSAPPVVPPAPIEQPDPITQNPPLVTAVTQPVTGTEADDELVSLTDQGNTILGLGGNDRIRGGAGNDQMDGGPGNDQMTGGPGDDTYTIDSSTDGIIELINQGNDQVFASVSYTLPENVEALTLTGTNPVNGTGNSSDNVIVGSTADNYLYGGDGNDQINGLAGKDYLYGQAGNDVLNGGDDDDWLVGDLGDDILNGGAGNDRVLGGAGNDTLAGEQGRNRLTGGADADQFVLNALDKNFDIITDFNAAQGDRIAVLTQGLGGKLKQGKLPATRFTLGSTADHEKAGLIYNSASGRLFWDADGIGSQKQVQIAKLTAGTDLSSQNILVLNG